MIFIREQNWTDALIRGCDRPQMNNIRMAQLWMNRKTAVNRYNLEKWSLSDLFKVFPVEQHQCCCSSPRTSLMSETLDLSITLIMSIQLCLSTEANALVKVMLVFSSWFIIYSTFPTIVPFAATPISPLSIDLQLLSPANFVNVNDEYFARRVFWRFDCGCKFEDKRFSFLTANAQESLHRLDIPKIVLYRKSYYF